MKRTIIADDEPNVLRVLQLALVRAGYDVQTCANGKQALQAVLRDPPDILITDIQMPVMTGVELCKALLAELPERRFPIFMMTSMTDIEYRDWAETVPGLVLLEKPLSMRRMMQKLEAYFATRAASAAPANPAAGSPAC